MRTPTTCQAVFCDAWRASLSTPEWRKERTAHFTPFWRPSRFCLSSQFHSSELGIPSKHWPSPEKLSSFGNRQGETSPSAKRNDCALFGVFCRFQATFLSFFSLFCLRQVEEESIQRSESHCEFAGVADSFVGKSVCFYGYCFSYLIQKKIERYEIEICQKIGHRASGIGHRASAISLLF